MQVVDSFALDSDNVDNEVVIGEKSALLDSSAAPAAIFGWDMWLVLSIVVLPFLFTFKPSEWFFVDYLIRTLHLDLGVINTSVFPLWTYSFLGFTLLFAVGSFFGLVGKWCLVTGLLAGALGAACVSLFQLASGANTLGLVMASEVLVGLYSAGEVMYSSLLYSLVPSLELFPHVASISRSARLFGQGLAGLTGQLMLHFNVTERVLFYVSFGAQLCAFFLALALPFSWKRDNHKCLRLTTMSPYPWRQIVALYRERNVQELFTFLLVSNAVHYLVIAFAQSLFEDMQPEIVHLYDAYLLGGANLIAFSAALLPIALLRRHRLRRARFIVLAMPVLCAVLLVLMSNMRGLLGATLWPSYAVYVLYQAVFEISRVVANASLAAHLKVLEMEHYAILFCFASAASLGLQAVVQLVLQQSGLNVRMYFVILGVSYLLLPVLLTSIHLIHARLDQRRAIVHTAVATNTKTSVN